MDKKVNIDNTYNFIIEYFTEKKIISRFEWIYDLLEDYIKTEGIQEKVFISEDILNHVVIDFFVDIYRLKVFQGIDITNDAKIYAYMIFWLLRHKPLQIQGEDSEGLVFINEKFASEMLRAFLFKDPKNISILNS